MHSEIESFRGFHGGMFGKCGECGRAVFLPCLACEIERMGNIVDGIEDVSSGCGELAVRLFGDERRRYEKIRRRKEREYETSNTVSK